MAMQSGEVAKSYGIVIEEDPQEVAFNKALEDWVHGKTSYSVVLNNLPRRSSGFFEEFVKKHVGQLLHHKR
jgi:hypothetical protein